MVADGEMVAEAPQTLPPSAKTQNLAFPLNQQPLFRHRGWSNTRSRKGGGVSGFPRGTGRNGAAPRPPKSTPCPVRPPRPVSPLTGHADSSAPPLRPSPPGPRTPRTDERTDRQTNTGSEGRPGPTPSPPGCAAAPQGRPFQGEFPGGRTCAVPPPAPSRRPPPGPPAPERRHKYRPPAPLFRRVHAAGINRKLHLVVC